MCEDKAAMIKKDRDVPQCLRKPEYTVSELEEAYRDDALRGMGYGDVKNAHDRLSDAASV